MTTQKPIRVKKRNGELAALDVEKIHAVVLRACEGLENVSASAVELRSSVQFFDGIETKKIHETMIRAAADLIDEDHPDYQYVAGRLVAYGVRKEVFGEFAAPSFYDHCKKIVEAGFYDCEWFESYTKEELDQLGGCIDHSRDDQFTYAGMEQWRSKYLVRNRATGDLFETPQFAYMAMACAAYSKDPRRMELIPAFYEATPRLSLPTPIMAGLRTPQKQFSSCVLIETDDSLDSINATASAIVKYVSQKAGIGIGAGRIRAIGEPIRNGDATHTGVIPFLKHFYSAVASCSQGGVRKGSATAFFTIFHPEIEDLIVLKNNKGTEETRIRHMDFGVQINKLFYERLIKNENITLISPNAVPGLYDAFFNDQEKFRELYEKAERNPRIRKKSIPAIKLFSALMGERKDTGRIYIQHVDHANTHSSFDERVAPVRQSNLCVEIDLPCKPLNDINDPEGEIALCTLAAINFGAYKKPEQMRGDCALLVRFLDNILSYQEYPVLAAKNSTDKYRPLGIGVTNFAYWMAKHGFSYEHPTQESLDTIAEWTQEFAYALTEASVNLAIERGPCAAWKDTKYGQGVAPYQTAAPDALALIGGSVINAERWKLLMEKAAIYGIRNATLMAGMPCETSSLINNNTNGFEPIRSYITSKKNKDMVVKQVAPGFPKLKQKCDLLWNMKSPQGYLKTTAVMQVFFDQGMSINTSYNPAFFENEEIPMSVLLKDLLFAYKLGHKQLYYFQTNDGAGEVEVKKSSEASCDSCVL